MKILHIVQSYSPETCGMQEVARQLSERMAAGGHHVTVATTFIKERQTDNLHGVQIEAFKISGNAVSGYNATASEDGRYRSFVTDNNFDIVVVFAAQWWGADIAMEQLADIRSATVFVPTGFSRLHDRAYRDYYWKMRQWMRAYDMNIFQSNTYRDIAFARTHHISNYTVIPNGADEREFGCYSAPAHFREIMGIPRAHTLILHVGSHTGQKGHDELFRIFARSAVTSATLLLVGSKASSGGCQSMCSKTAEMLNASTRFKRDDKKIILADFGRQDTINAFFDADLLLFPSNIECSPIVLFEACASMTPFLATDVGNCREIAGWTGAGDILPTYRFPWHRPKEVAKELFRLALHSMGAPVAAPRRINFAGINKSAALLTELTKNKQKRHALAQNGYRCWKEMFTWDKIAQQYERCYLDLFGKRQQHVR